MHIADDKDDTLGDEHIDYDWWLDVHSATIDVLYDVEIFDELEVKDNVLIDVSESDELDEMVQIYYYFTELHSAILEAYYVLLELDELEEILYEIVDVLEACSKWKYELNNFYLTKYIYD